MISLIASFISGIILGLSLTAPPGPITAIMVRESVKSNLHGTSVGFGAMTADFILMLLTFLFSKAIPTYLVYYVYLIGSVIMFYLAYKTLKVQKPKNTSMHANYLLGLTIGISNPFQIAWWLTVGIFLLIQLKIFSIFGLFTGILFWVLFFPIFVYRTKKYYEPKWINYISAFILFVFGIFMLFIGLTNIRMV